MPLPHPAEPPGPDLDLVARIRAGDELAFAALFRLYRAGLCSYAYVRVGAAAEAEEIVMDVFRRLWERRTQWIVTGSVRSYLFAAVEHGVVNHARHRRVELRLVRDVGQSARDLPAFGTPPAQPAELAERDELARAIAGAIDTLPERTRAVFVLWQQQLRYAEIADTMGISIKTVESQLARAIRLLRERLADFRP